jgi:hypothetical protein
MLDFVFLRSDISRINITKFPGGILMQLSFMILPFHYNAVLIWRDNDKN